MIHKMIRERERSKEALEKKIINNLYKFILFVNKKNIFYFKQFFLNTQVRTLMTFVVFI